MLRHELWRAVGILAKDSGLMGILSEQCALWAPPILLLVVRELLKEIDRK